MFVALVETRRRDETIKELQKENEQLRAILKTLEPKPHWPNATKSLVMRLRGIYAVGPNADQMGPNDTPEFGWRDHTQSGFFIPGIQLEAAARISELEDEVAKLREIVEDCDECYPLSLTD